MNLSKWSWHFRLLAAASMLMLLGCQEAYAAGFIDAEGPARNTVTVTGILSPAGEKGAGWAVRTGDGTTCRILNPKAFNSINLLTFGSLITVTGRPQPDASMPEGGEKALMADTITLKQGAAAEKPEPAAPPALRSAKTISPDSIKTRQKTTVLEAAKPGPRNAGTTEIQTKTREISLFFPSLSNLERDPVTLLGAPAARTLQGSDVPRQAIRALLQGPSEPEKRQGFFADADIGRLRIDQLNVGEDEKAVIVLEAPADFRFRSAIVPRRLEEQISRTLRQFDGIRDVAVSVRSADHAIIWSSF